MSAAAHLTSTISAGAAVALQAAADREPVVRRGGDVLLQIDNVSLAFGGVKALAEAP